MLQLFAQTLRAARRRYYEVALDHLTRTNPCHPDIPGIVHRINDLRS